MDLPKLSDEDEISPALRTLIEAIRSMTNDTNMLVEHAVAGNLSARADLSRHQFQTGKLIEAR